MCEPKPYPKPYPQGAWHVNHHFAQLSGWSVASVSLSLSVCDSAGSNNALLVGVHGERVHCPLHQPAKKKKTAPHIFSAGRDCESYRRHPPSIKPGPRPATDFRPAKRGVHIQREEEREREGRPDMSDIPDEENAATQTLNCRGPFEVLQLGVRVYEPLDIKR